MDDEHCLSAAHAARFGAAMFAKTAIIKNLFSPVFFGSR